MVFATHSLHSLYNSVEWSRSHPREVGNGYGIGDAKNSIFSTVNRNRRRNGIGNARIRTCSFPLQNTFGSMALDLRGSITVSRASWRPEYKDQEALGHRQDLKSQILELPVTFDSEVWRILFEKLLQSLKLRQEQVNAIRNVVENQK